MVNIDLNSTTRPTLPLGRVGESNVQSIIFDYSAWKEEYGDGALLVIVQRPKEKNSYPVALHLEGTNATWNVTKVDTSIAGNGSAQVAYLVDATVKKSVVYTTFIQKSVKTTGYNPEDPYESWLEEMAEIAKEVAANSTAAQNAAASASESEANALGYSNNADVSATLANGYMVKSKEYLDETESIEAQVESKLTVAQGFADAAQRSADNANLHDTNAYRWSNNASVSESNAAQSEVRAKASEDLAEGYMQEAKEAAETAIGGAGYLNFYIDENGDLVYEYNDKTSVRFRLVDGDLVYEPISE